MKNKKGFTLIELLAIIVILAIIAVITVPIILNIIENSKIGAATDSAYGFKDAVNKSYLTKLSGDSDYEIPDNTYTVEELKTQIDLSLSGKEPASNSWVRIEDNDVTAGCLQYDEYKVEITDGKVTNTEKGTCETGSSSVIDELPGTLGANNDGYKYLTTPIVVYYNPITSSICDSTEAVSTDGTRTGCMKWFAYSVKNGIANMLLDHNITSSSEKVAWLSDTDFSNKTTLGSELGITGMGDTNKSSVGPLTALYTLKQLTDTGNPSTTWTTSVQGEYANYTNDFYDLPYTINYSGYKARLITAREICNITGLTGYGVINASWLYENLIVSNAYNPSSWKRYWTSSPFSNIDEAFAVAYGSYIDNGTTGSRMVDSIVTETFGIRPVITVPYSVLINFVS